MDTVDKTDNIVFQTYMRQGKAFVKGQGATLWDEEGNEYTDFLAGIAAAARHHTTPEPAAAAVPTITGTIAAGRVRRRAPRIHRCIVEVCHRRASGPLTGPG